MDDQPNTPRRGRDPSRIPMILGALEREWRKNSDLRLGQLLVNLLRNNTNLSREGEGRALFSLEDGELLRWLGPETKAAETYIREEPQKARQAWRVSEQSLRPPEDKRE